MLEYVVKEDDFRSVCHKTKTGYMFHYGFYT